VRPDKKANGTRDGIQGEMTDDREGGKTRNSRERGFGTALRYPAGEGRRAGKIFLEFHGKV
jgi:hypothetical protein